MVFEQVIAQGNIIIGEELEMISRRKSFAIALSREMVPTARLVVYYVSGQPEEIVMDSISFYVSGLRANPVSFAVRFFIKVSIHTLPLKKINEQNKQNIKQKQIKKQKNSHTNIQKQIPKRLYTCQTKNRICIEEFV